MLPEVVVRLTAPPLPAPTLVRTRLPPAALSEIAPFTVVAEDTIRPPALSLIVMLPVALAVTVLKLFAASSVMLPLPALSVVARRSSSTCRSGHRFSHRKTKRRAIS